MRTPDGTADRVRERAELDVRRRVRALAASEEEEHWHFYELAVEPGDHPCLRATPKRALDEATAEQIGDFLVLEWRGKRRQILYRPE